MQLSIDTAGPVAGIALTDGEMLVASLSWRTRAGHAAELLPAIERVLDGAGVARDALDAIFVCRGPGSYGGLRVGISTALGLAFALDAGLLGVGRLEADALLHAAAPGPIVPVHDAGRGDLAWAVYASRDGWQELGGPRLTAAAALLAGAPEGALLCGEIGPTLAALARAERPDLTIRTGMAHARRAETIAALAWPRYRDGARDSHLALEPVYLREPNITISKKERARHTEHPHGSL